MGRQKKTRHHYALVLDFEATCDQGDAPQPQEIIEFPTVLVELETMEPVDEFTSFVRPYHHPELTAFCTELTSIRTEDVARAPLFAEVLEAHGAWLDGHGLDEENALFVTCGDWDLNRMFPAQCQVAVPEIARLRPIYTRWLNLKTTFCEVMGRQKAPGMGGMLRQLQLPLQGHHHRGIDDCRNLAALLRELVWRGGRVEASAALAPKRLPAVTLRLRWEGGEEVARLERRSVATLQRLAESLVRGRVASLRKADGQVLAQDEDLYWLASGEEILLRLV